VGVVREGRRNDPTLYAHMDKIKIKKKKREFQDGG
jgi:hypothetical protein